MSRKRQWALTRSLPRRHTKFGRRASPRQEFHPATFWKKELQLSVSGSAIYWNQMAASVRRPGMEGRRTEMLGITFDLPEAHPHPRRVQGVIACTDSLTQEVFSNLLTQKGLEPVLASTVNETRLLLGQEETALIICQVSFSDGDFRDLLSLAARIGSKVPIILCTDFYDVALYLEAMELGAFDSLACPCPREGAAWVVGNALQKVPALLGALSVGNV
jgi:PleD family two-component response regulator